MKSSWFGLAVAAAVGLSSSLYAGGVMEVANWTGNTGGNKITPAEVTAIDSPHGPAIQVKVVEEAGYQGVDVLLPEPIDLSKVESITFKIHQTAYNRYPCHGCLHLDYPANKGIMTAFLMEDPEDGWCEVTVPIDLTKFTPLRRNDKVKFGMVKGLQFSIYKALSQPGQVMEIADLQFKMKAE